MFEDCDTPVRCSRGHVYTSTWVPLLSVKSLRLGWKRFQYCPVGKHWATTERLTDPTPEEREQAAQAHDWRIP